MPIRSRRRVLQMSAVALTGIAGCTGDSDDDSDDGGSDDIDLGGNEETERPDADNDGVPDVEDAYPRDSDLSRQLYSSSDTRKIEEDEWRYYEMEFTSTGMLHYDFIVRDGPEIDVIFIEQSEYSYFKEEERYQYIPALSALDTAGDTVQNKVGAGSYYLIFDNSNNGEAAPPANFSNDVATVEFEIEAAQ